MRQAQYGVAYAFDLPIPKAGSTDFAVSADWTPAAGDVKVLIDGVDNGNIATLPVAITGRAAWRIALSAAEMTGKEITVLMVDSATKVIVDQAETIQTYGHQSAADPRGILLRFTAASGSTSTVVAPAGGGISATDDAYNGAWWRDVGGTGAGIAFGQVIDYVGSTRTFTLYQAGPPVQGRISPVALDNTSVIEIVSFPIAPAAVTVGAGGIISANAVQLAGQTVAASGTVTFPAATLASTTNITAGVITTVTNLTNLPTMPTDWITAAGLSAGAVTEMQSGLATAAALTTVDDFLDTEIAAIKAKTDSLTFTVAGQLDSNIQSINDVAVVGNGVSPKFGV